METPYNQNRQNCQGGKEMKGTKTRFIRSIMAVLFIAAMLMSTATVAFAATSISQFRITVDDTKYEGNNPTVKNNTYGCYIDSVKWDRDVSKLYNGEKAFVTLKLVTYDGYYFNGSYDYSNFEITNGSYWDCYYSQDGNLYLEIEFVKGFGSFYEYYTYEEVPDYDLSGLETWWDTGSRSKAIANWTKVTGKNVTYTIQLVVGDDVRTIKEGLTTNSYDLTNELRGDLYYKKQVRFRVRVYGNGEYLDFFNSPKFDWNLHNEIAPAPAPSTPTPAPTPGQQYNGWRQDGNTWYYYENGTMLKNRWVNFNGFWYYMGSDGKMITGWYTIKNYKYYFDQSGIMSTGWRHIGDKWYMFGGDGKMKTNYDVLSSDEQVMYHLNERGELVTGWAFYNNEWKYIDEVTGNLVYGWKQIDNNWYYFTKPTGGMAKGWVYIDGRYYKFTDEGVYTFIYQ